MRFLLNFATFLGIVAIAAGCSPAADIPKREPGFWEMASTSETTPGPGPSVGDGVSRVCMDAAMEQRMAFGSQPGLTCSKNIVRKTPTGLALESVCQVDGSTVSSKAVVTGDIKRQYRIDNVTTVAPPIEGIAERRNHVVAKWLGPCPADRKPGDMVFPDGRVVSTTGARS